MNQRFTWLSAFGALVLLVTLTLASSGCSDEPSGNETPLTECSPSTNGESCGGGDEDCDGLVDEAGAEGCVDYFEDADGDGVADPNASSRCLCEPVPPFTNPEPYVADPCADVACDDGNPCTEDSCNAITGGCIHAELDDGNCDDGDPCSENTVCVAGQCGLGDRVECDDGDPCTDDECFPYVGCRAEPNNGDCDDGNPCTELDSCIDGVCQGEPTEACGPSVCGDGVCAATESCASCEVDCSPLGFGGCQSECDPLSAETSCSGGLCLLTVPNGGGFTINEELPGSCGPGCTSDTDCYGGEICVNTGGANVCRTECDSECPNGGICTTLDDGRSICSSAACDPTDPLGCGEAEYCAVSSDGTGRCEPGCGIFGGEPRCTTGEACIPRDLPRFHQGTCVAETVPCSVINQTGCADGEQCSYVGAGMGLKSAALCVPAVGESSLGDGCRTDDFSCGPGLVCAAQICQQACLPGALCPDGAACVDVSADFGQAPGTLGACIDECGDAVCSASEHCGNCPRDCDGCGPVCDDGACVGDETCESCPQDCGACPTCGDGQCAGFGEDCGSCPGDCGECVCGDGVCGSTENCGDCPDDCSCLCGDGLCSDNEACYSCSEDCGECSCGDGQCNGPGEGCGSCPDDCGACFDCGNGTCDPDENCLNCPGDCGVCAQAVCGDGKCNFGERCDTCAEDCACAPVCGDGTCDVLENCMNCPSDCTAFDLDLECNGSCTPATPGCADNNVCFPTVNGTSFNTALIRGNGVCGEGCQTNADCFQATCVSVAGVESQGVCVGYVESCNPAISTSCGSSKRCVPRAGTPGEGVCLDHCTSSDGATCGGIAGNCRLLTGPDVNTGVCIGQPTACDPFDDTSGGGCEAGATCVPQTAWPYVGTAFVCRASITGVLGLEESCTPASDNETERCLPGLHCGLDGTCREACTPNAASCPGGALCEDVSGSFGATAGTFGLCLTTATPVGGTP